MSGWYDNLYRAIRSNRLLDATAEGLVRRVPDLTITRRVPHVGGKLSFGLRRHHWLMGRNCFEGHRRTLGLFARQVREGDVFYDIGANIGYYARWVLANLPASRVIGFEPMTANVRLLRRNAMLLGEGERLTIIDTALGDRDGDAELQIDDMSDGSAVLNEVSGGSASDGRAAKGLGGKTEAVAIRRLDTLRAERELPPPNVMKIDTEGAEDIVLRGATATLAEHRPRLILAMHGRDRAKLVLDLLGEVGYHAYGWVRSEGDLRWSALAPDDAERMADNNCIASVHEADVAPPVAEYRLATT